MLRYAAIFLVIALVAAVFGFTGIAAGAAWTEPWSGSAARLRS